MSRPRFAPRVAFSAALAALSALMFVGTSYGQATVSDFYSPEALSGSEIGILACLPDVAGTLSGTDTVAGQLVDTGRGVHVSGTETQDYRIDFTDGRYLLSHSPTHFEFDANQLGRDVFTAAQQDRGTLYYSDGTPIGPVTVFTLSHITWDDVNNDGNPDPGEITANVDDFRISCP